ncbi:hypothetical protein Ancab_039487 [Ancistrocladus abbreviatus]
MGLYPYQINSIEALRFSDSRDPTLISDLNVSSRFWAAYLVGFVQIDVCRGRLVLFETPYAVRLNSLALRRSEPDSRTFFHRFSSLSHRQQSALILWCQRARPAAFFILLAVSLSSAFRLGSAPGVRPLGSGEYHSINNKKKVAIQFPFELGSNLLSIDRREQTAIGCFAYLFYYGRLGDIRGRPSSLSGRIITGPGRPRAEPFDGSTGAGDRGSLGAGRGVLTGAGPGLASGMRVTAYAFLKKEKARLWKRECVSCLPRSEYLVPKGVKQGMR